MKAIKKGYRGHRERYEQDPEYRGNCEVENKGPQVWFRLTEEAAAKMGVMFGAAAGEYLNSDHFEEWFRQHPEDINKPPPLQRRR